MTGSTRKYKRALNIRSFNLFSYMILVLFLILVLTSCGVNKEPEMVADSSFGQTSEHTDKGNKLLESGDIDGAAVEFREAMLLNPKDTQARLGAAKVQIKRESYELAKDSLETAIMIEPDNRELYETYIELCKLAGGINYGRALSDLARENKQQWFIDEYIPETPAASIKSGSYDQIQELSFQNDDAAEIVFDMKNDYNNLFAIKYKKPYQLRRGETHITAYSVKDGIPSESVDYDYTIQYDPIEIQLEDEAIEEAIREELGFDGEQQIYDTDLETITELRIEASDKQIHTLDDLKWMGNLVNLRLYNQKEISEWEGLNATNVNELRIIGSNIDNVSFLNNMSSITYLDLGSNKISNLSGVENLNNLYHVGINDNPVTDLSPIYQLDNLTSISMDGEQSKGLDQYKNFNNIEQLTIFGKPEFDVDSLKNLKQLYRLSLLGSGITDISFVSKLSGLKYLDFEGNDIIDISPLKELENLKNLDLHRNKNLTDISPVIELKNLEKLDIRHTNVSDIQDLKSANPNCEINI